MATLRPMTEADVPAAVTLWGSAFGALAARHALPPRRSAASDVRFENRMRHLMRGDPGGSWVADEGGVVVGLSQSFVRDGYWVLAHLAVLPGHQGKGLGGGLLDLALTNSARDSPGSIQSSRDPAAMALYTTAGFALHPAVMADGIMRAPVGRDERVRAGDETDLGLVDAVDRQVRGSTRTVDIAVMLGETGNRLLVVDGEGYAIAQDERVVTLGARNEEVASALLKTALAEMSGTHVELGWVTARQQWAVRTLVAAGIDLHPSGAMMVRGMDGPPVPYIPSGAFG